jgi:hypothetical protein
LAWGVLAVFEGAETVGLLMNALFNQHERK